MKRLLFLLILVITLVSCSSKSGNLQSKSKVESAIEQKKLVKFRAKEVWFSDILLKYNSSTHVQLLELDPMYKIGDTIEVLDRMGVDHSYVLID